MHLLNYISYFLVIISRFSIFPICFSIPGLSENFLYLNDDLMFGLPVWPEDFFSLDGGYKASFDFYQLIYQYPQLISYTI